MPIIFTPNGLLDVATDPSDLPEKVEGKVAISGSMLRCSNLTLDRMGMASTRKGSQKINTTAISAPNRIIEQGGVRYSFGSTSIYRDETALSGTYTDDDWSAVLYNPYNVTTQCVYCLNGTDRKKIEGSTVYEWGVAAPTYAPAVTGVDLYGYTTSGDLEHMTAASLYGYQITLGETDNYWADFQHELDWVDNFESTFPESSSYVTSYHFEGESSYSSAGKYEVVYTYARYVGDTLVAESDPSPARETQIRMAIKVTWSATTDAQVTHVRLYRSLADTAGAWYYMGVYAIADLTATISMKDEDLGAAVATNHDRPPLGTQVIGPSLNGQLFILKDNLLYYSLGNQPEYWPPTYYLEVTPPQFPLMGACFFGGNLLVASKHEIFVISGSSSASYFAQPMSAVTGTHSRNCFISVKGVGVFHLGSDGIYLYTMGQDTNITDANFKPIFEGTAKGSIPGIDKNQLANCLMLVWQNKFWFGYPATGETYCKDFLVFDLETKRWTHYQYPSAMRSMAVDYHNFRLLGGDESGYVWVLDSTDTTDGGTTITWDLQSKEFVQFPKYFPRYARWDVNLNNGATATGQVLLEGTVKQAHTLTVDRATRKRLVATCTGTRMSVRVTGTGPVDIHGVEVE